MSATERRMVRQVRPPPKRTGWPVLLVVVLGAVLAVERVTPLRLPEWILVAVRMTFFVAVAAAVLAGFLWFVTWWFWGRHR